MALAGLLPPEAEVMPALADQVEVEGSRFLEADPNDQLRFLQRAHYQHVRNLAKTFEGMFPQSFILTLLPTHLDADKIAEVVAQFALKFFANLWPVAYRMDNLKVDPSRFPGWEMGEQLLPVCTVLRKDTNGVLFCLHVRPPERESEPWRPDKPGSPKVRVAFRSALLLLGPTSDAPVVRNALLGAYMSTGGWVICGHNAMLYDVAMQQMVDCATAESRLKQNCLALAKAVLGQLCQAPGKRPVRIRFVQACLRLSDHFGWPVPEGALDGLLSRALRRTEKLTVLDGGRILLNAAGQQVNHADIVLLQLVRTALEADEGRLLQEFLTTVVSPDPAPQFHPLTSRVPAQAEVDLKEPPGDDERFESSQDDPPMPDGRARRVAKRSNKSPKLREEVDGSDAPTTTPPPGSPELYQAARRKRPATRDADQRRIARRRRSAS